MAVVLFVHPAFMPAWDRVRSLPAMGGDPFSMASGVDAAILLAGFGLPVAPFDFGYSVLEKPSNEIDSVLNAFSRWRTAFVGYSVCDVPFYVLLTIASKRFGGRLRATLSSRILGDYSRGPAAHCLPI